MADSEHGTIIFVVSLLLIFVLILNGMTTSYFFSEQPNYLATQYPNIGTPSAYDPGSIGKAGVKSEDYENVTYGEYSFYLTYDTTNDTELVLIWNNIPGDRDNLYLSHRHPWFWFFTRLVSMSPWPVTKDYVNSTQNNNASQLFARCMEGDIPEVFVEISFDNTTYNNVTHAWDNGQLRFYCAFLSNATLEQAHYDVWTLLGQLLTFTMPNVHPLINAIIAIPIWISIILGLIYVLDKIKPF